jgi:hypothetical protein
MKLNKKSKVRRKSCKKNHRKNSTTRKYKIKFNKFCKGGMINNNQLTTSQEQTEEEECPICLETMSRNDNTVFTNLFNCIHIFHKRCIIQWVNTERNNNQDIFQVVCPMCRAQLSEEGTEKFNIINRILDVTDEFSRMNMFRDILQQNYFYQPTFFQLYILPISRRTGNFLVSDTATVLGAGIFFYLSFVITGSNARELLRERYGEFMVLQIIRMIFNASSMVRGENRLGNAFSIGVFYISFCFYNLQGNTGHDVLTPYGRFNVNDVLRYINDIFEHFLVDDNDFFQYFNHLNDSNNREPYGRFGGSARNSSNKTLRFKFTSMNDVKEFLNIVKQNKEKLESLLDKQPFTLSVFFPEVEYRPELVQKLRPLIKN